MSPISDDDLDAAARRKLQSKPRPKGTLPYLPDAADPDVLRDFISLGYRPRPGWRVWEFSRAGRQKGDPCSLTIRNGRELATVRFNRQGDLYGRDMRAVVLAVSDGELRPPHLTAGEIEDLWAALCILGTVASEYDDRDEARKWIEQMLVVAVPLRGLSLVPDTRHDALMTIRAQGEFTRPDALAMVRGGGDNKWQRRPVRVIDKVTGEHFLRSGETATFLRHVLGAEPLAHSTLRARLSEVGVEARLFEDYRSPHPKLTMYRLTEALIDALDEAEK